MGNNTPERDYRVRFHVHHAGDKEGNCSDVQKVCGTYFRFENKQSEHVTDKE